MNSDLKLHKTTPHADIAEVMNRYGGKATRYEVRTVELDGYPHSRLVGYVFNWAQERRYKNGKRRAPAIHWAAEDLKGTVVGYYNETRDLAVWWLTEGSNQKPSDQAV